MTVRVFGGWDYDEADVRRPDFASTGYLAGVPMGSDLTAAPKSKSPRLMVRAMRDPDGANLDRTQIIKGWLDSKGELQEQIYDVACSDGRAISADQRCEKAVGSTVDVAAASYTNSIGDVAQMAYWEDPDFDPKEGAFYYVRVLEIPTPRWTTHDAAFFGVDRPQAYRQGNRREPRLLLSGPRPRICGYEALRYQSARLNEELILMRFQIHTLDS